MRHNLCSPLGSTLSSLKKRKQLYWKGSIKRINGGLLTKLYIGINLLYYQKWFCLEHTWCVELNLSPCKLDGVGPVDNRPSTNKLHHFVRKKEKEMWHVTRDMWHVTRDTWHVTRDTWHVTRDTFWGVNILSKFQLPSSYRLWFMILWRSGGKGWIT